MELYTLIGDLGSTWGKKANDFHHQIHTLGRKSNIKSGIEGDFGSHEYGMRMIDKGCVPSLQCARDPGPVREAVRSGVNLHPSINLDDPGFDCYVTVVYESDSLRATHSIQAVTVFVVTFSRGLPCTMSRLHVSPSF